MFGENEFYLYENKTHFHINGFAFRLALRKRLGAPPPNWVSMGGGGEGVESGAPFSNNTPTGAHAPF